MDKDEKINNQFLGVWSIYIKFWTAFLALNMVAVGLVVEKVAKGKPLICLAFAVQNLLAILTAVGVAIYSNSVCKELESPLSTVRTLGVWGGVANGLSGIALILVWIAVWKS